MRTIKELYLKAARITRSISDMECGIHKLEVEDAFVRLFIDNSDFNAKEFRLACNRKDKQQCFK